MSASFEATKTCRRCRTDQPANSFSGDKRNHDGLDCYCHSCRAELGRERRRRWRSVVERTQRPSRITERDTDDPERILRNEEGGAA